MEIRTDSVRLAPDPAVETPPPAPPIRFGSFELDIDSGQLRKEGRVVRLPPQPFKLLWLLASRPGKLLTRNEIRSALWTDDTFIDFEQGVNFAIKQVREALRDDPERPVYIQTVPKRGYRFIANVEGHLRAPRTARGGTDSNLQKVLWANIAEMRLAEAQRRARLRVVLQVGAIAVGVLALLGVFRAFR
jgi:DNA-binding winged helix-turn-helix (wHTH) protein